MNVCVYPNGDLAAIAAAVLIAGQVVDKPDCVLGLATGSTPLPIYRELIAMSHRGVLDFSKVTTYNLDEYVGLGPDHPCSYRRFMRENLFSQINLPADHIHIPNGLAEDKDEECHNYDAAIAAAGQIDLQLLGLGANGHIGFNEPATPYDSYTRSVLLTDKTKQMNAYLFGGVESVPEKAVTMGLKTICEAKNVILVAFGSEKAEIIHQLVYGKTSTYVPAAMLQMHMNMTLLLDDEAAEKIK